jgi:hypothetical protein
MRLLQRSGGEPLYSLATLLGRSRRLPEPTRRVPSTRRYEIFAAQWFFAQPIEQTTRRVVSGSRLLPTDKSASL